MVAEKSAVVPHPSLEPLVVDPARVLTARDGSAMARTRKLFKSAT